MINHLGNVLVTISDKKIGVDNNADGIIDYYNADVVTANDYYPGGMQMPGRKYSQSNSTYRYGFNGKEKDNGTGEGNLDFGDRILDVRLGGRWLSCDPLMKKYPGESPYLFTGGNPILFVDADGRDRIVSFYALTAKGERVLIGRTTYKQSYEVTYGINKAIHIWETGHYYKADIEQTVLLDLASGKVIDDYRKEGVTKPISMATYYWGPDSKPSMSQSKASGSYQDYGYYVTGNSNGQNIDFIDKAGETLGSMEIGGLLDVLSVAGADPAAFFESFNKSALENVLTGLEKIKATKETQEVIKIVKENVSELLEKKGETPATSPANTKTGATQKAPSSTKSSSPKSNKADSIFIHERTLNGKSVPTNDTTPYNDEKIKKVPAPKN